MIELKVKCTICAKEESNKETIKEVSDIVEKYELKAEHYLSLLNLMSGKCLNSDEHSFIFDEAFLENVNEIVAKHKFNIAEIGKLKVINEGLKKEADELTIKVQEFQSKSDSNRERMSILYKSTYNYENELSESTGHNKIEFWY